MAALQTGSMQTRDNKKLAQDYRTDLKRGAEGLRARSRYGDREVEDGSGGGRDQQIKGSDCDFLGQVNG